MNDLALEVYNIIIDNDLPVHWYENPPSFDFFQNNGPISDFYLCQCVETRMMGIKQLKDFVGMSNEERIRLLKELYDFPAKKYVTQIFERY